MPKNLVAGTLGISALLIFRCSSRSGGLLRNNICDRTCQNESLAGKIIFAFYYIFEYAMPSTVTLFPEI